MAQWKDPIAETERALREEIAMLREVNAEQAKQIDRLSAIIRQAQQEARK